MGLAFVPACADHRPAQHSAAVSPVPVLPARIVPYAPPSGAVAGTPSTPPSSATRKRAVATRPTYAQVRWTFDTGPSGWVAGEDAGVAAAHTPVQAGTGSLAIRNDTDQTADVTTASGSSPSTWTPARSGMRVFGAVAIRARSAARNTYVTVTFLDADGQRIDQAAGQLLTDTSRVWYQTYTAVGIAPPGTAYAVIRVTVLQVAPGETHYVDDASLYEYPGGSPRVVGPLHTAGTQILDAHEAPVIFRGFTRVGLEGADADPPTADDIAHAKAWGANIIRLPLGEQFWLRSSCHYRPDYAAQVDNAVHLVTSLGMVALLDLHWNSLSACGAYGQQPMADYPGAVTFWQQVAARYKGNPLVAFDLYNEPHNISDAVWRTGGPVSWQGTQYTAAGMQQMYAAVRGTGATNVIVVTGNSWGNIWPSTAPIVGTNVVYGVHAYTCAAHPPPHCNNLAPYDPDQFFRWWASASQRVPVAVTEFGWPNPADGRYMTAVIDYAEAHGWGWTAFTWGDASWGPFSLLASAGPGRAYEPRPTGEAVLAAFPGS
jgi:hypothetical protein